MQQSVEVSVKPVIQVCRPVVREDSNLKNIMTLLLFEIVLSKEITGIRAAQRRQTRVKPLAKRTRKSTEVCKTSIYVRTRDGWPNGLTGWLASSCKSQKDELRSTCVDLRWVAKR